MRQRQLGSDGPSVSVVGLGCNNLRSRMSDEAARETVDAALAAGVTLFDTADIYGGAGGSESLLGELLEGRRQRVVLATKFGMDMGDGAEARGSRSYIRSAVEASLRRLRTDWIDLYQIHQPDPLTPLDETLGALGELVTEGKVRHIGSSNFEGWRIVDADWIARTSASARFVSAQNQYSLVERSVEAEVVPACLHIGVGILPFFPLAHGLLSGKYLRGQAPPGGSRLARPGSRAPEILTEANYSLVEALAAFGRERGRSILEVAIAGLAAQPAVASVIAGATSAQQIAANAAAGAWEPSEADRVALRDRLDTSPGERTAAA